MKDLVQVADEPQFTVHDHVAAAAWVNPTITSGHHPIVLKRLGSKTSFSLGIHDGNVEFSVVLESGTTVLSRAPIATNVWTHVAGLYDGRFLFLFVNGEQVGQVLQVGTLRNVVAPLRIGATTQTQHFDGLIDEVWVSTHTVTGADLMALSCIAAPSTVSVTPAKGGPVPPDTAVHYDVALTNHDTGACRPSSYFLSMSSSGGPPPPPKGGFGDAGPAPDSGTIGGPSNDGITTNVNPGFISAVPAGTTAHFGVDVTGSEDAESGVHALPFVVDNVSRFEEVAGSLSFELTAPAGCHVSTKHELMITSTSVVDDPIRTSFSGPPGDPRRGVWTFGRLMRDLSKTPADAAATTEKLFQHWLTDQTVNGFTVAARPAIKTIVLDNWPRTPDGALDLDRSPLQLLAIVNRVDLRDLSKGNAGEGRFVFGVLGPGGNPEQFTIIMEYKLPATTPADVLSWANAWHDLSTQPFPSEAYNQKLEALTLRFSGRNAAPTRPNGSALGQLRTNEISLVPRWEFREFTLSATTGAFDESPIELTPDLSFNGTDTLGQFVNDNEASIIAETDAVPAQFLGKPFLTGAVFNDLIFWSAKNIKNNEARFHLSLNTCNGCHGPETGTKFLQISPRFPGSEASLAPFLTGTTVFDPITNAPRVLRDLARRNDDLKALVCAPPTPKSAATSASGPTLEKGIGRVH